MAPLEQIALGPFYGPNNICMGYLGFELLTWLNVCSPTWHGWCLQVLAYQQLTLVAPQRAISWADHHAMLHVTSPHSHRCTDQSWRLLTAVKDSSTHPWNTARCVCVDFWPCSWFIVMYYACKVPNINVLQIINTKLIKYSRWNVSRFYNYIR